MLCSMSFVLFVGVGMTYYGYPLFNDFHLVMYIVKVFIS
jgi:hypothetical protein